MANITSYVPEGVAWIRAAVASIPVAGGALDHLLFDKADAIRAKNLQAAIDALSEQLKSVKESTVDKSWFDSEEALAAFRLMADKVSYEPDPKKVEAMGKIVGACGSTKHSGDPKKLSILEHLARLSQVQLRLLSIIAKLPATEKKLELIGLQQTASGIWIGDIVTAIKAVPQFWEGTMALDQELEVLESLNMVRQMQLMGPTEPGYVITGIGKVAATYVQTAGL
jgi:hypothetical protein